MEVKSKSHTRAKDLPIPFLDAFWILAILAVQVSLGINSTRNKILAGKEEGTELPTLNRKPQTNMYRDLRSSFASLLLSAFCLVFAGCGPSPKQLIIAQKASEKVAACKALGDKPVIRIGKCLVWNLVGNTTHPAHQLLKETMRYSEGEGPLTVYLVSDARSESVGIYSVSMQPAYRQWVDVYVVQFSDSTDSGTPIATHQVVSLDPRHSRPVQQSPEYGDPSPKIADWIDSLPSNPEMTQMLLPTSYASNETVFQSTPGGSNASALTNHPASEYLEVGKTVLLGKTETKITWIGFHSTSGRFRKAPWTAVKQRSEREPDEIGLFIETKVRIPAGGHFSSESVVLEDADGRHFIPSIIYGYEDGYLGPNGFVALRRGNTIARKTLWYNSVENFTPSSRLRVYDDGGYFTAESINVFSGLTVETQLNMVFSRYVSDPNASDLKHLKLLYQPELAEAELAKLKQDDRKAALKELDTKKQVEDQNLLSFQMARANAGSENAQYELGLRYLTGRGVAQNTNEARVWLEKAAGQGNIQAARKIEELKKH